MKNYKEVLSEEQIQDVFNELQRLNADYIIFEGFIEGYCIVHFKQNYGETYKSGSILKSSAILYRVSKPGCAALVHHFETVAGSFPSCSASHLLVFFFSAKTTFSLFKSLSIIPKIELYAKIINN